MEQAPYDHLAKVLLIGESGVGKTCILQRFISNQFNANFLTTIAIDFKTKNIKVKDKVVKLQLWDTAGQERFNTLTESFFKGSHGVIVVYSIVSRESFIAINKWMNQVRASAPSAVKLCLIGNKSDLEEDREVSPEEGENLAESFDALFFEVSAFNGENINEMFQGMGELVLTDLEIEEEEIANGVSFPKKKKKRKKCC